MRSETRTVLTWLSSKCKATITKIRCRFPHFIHKNSFFFFLEIPAWNFLMLCFTILCWIPLQCWRTSFSYLCLPFVVHVVTAEERGFFCFFVCFSWVYSRLLVQILSFLKTPRAHEGFPLHCPTPADLICRAVYPAVCWKTHWHRVWERTVSW